MIINIIVLIGISGCAVPAKKTEPFGEFGLYVAGERIKKPDTKRGDDALQYDALQDQLGDLKKVLDNTPHKSLNLQDRKDRATLRGKLIAIHTGELSADKISPEFLGFCGLSNILAFRTVMDILDNPRRKPHQVYGKIRKWVFHLDNDDPQDMKGHGHLAVEMKTEYFDHVNGSDVVTRREILNWDIEVKRNGYKVVKREGPRDISNREPFPNTIPLPAEKVDPSNADSIWARDLDYKLFARGNSIFVRNIYRQVDDNSIELLPRTHSYYNITECSCIDIMFDGFPPELELPPQAGYCLGRCNSPYIMNSR